ncbi:hypothetical protein Clacol_001946 [Clathrus columnatus]|uniref:Uncharacterized protein n=1 Tax=Clathrus columnatus TaxID=1419009 RepID=A0AAV4ZZF6_9AGAM|nr:hypothetical protein Clacol_001946 [Clathrus columnatus]
MSPTTPVQPGIIKYVIESTDVLDQFRVNISEEGSNKILWYKKRHISEDEIVESVIVKSSPYDNTDKSLKWTIHRPRDGWYLRLRPPTFPPNVFISLVPPPPPVKASELPTTNRPQMIRPDEEGSLTFVVRTPPPKLLDGVPTSSSTHSYPPSPSIQSPTIRTPSITSPPPIKINELNVKLNKSIPSPTNVNVTRFLLSPSLPLPISPTAGVGGFLSRTLAFLSPPIKAHVSFSLAPVSAQGEPSSPLLTFVEQTSTFSVATAGILAIDKTIERQMGIESTFWVAVSLAYLEFLSDRDSYLAAANG